jgi:hypothetical protein
MTSAKQCATCKGMYFDPQPDGSRYFHACPDVPNENYQPDIAAPDYDPRETVNRRGHRDERPIAGMAYRDDKLHVPVFDVEENRPILKPGKFAIVSEGKGAE